MAEAVRETTMYEVFIADAARPDELDGLDTSKYTAVLLDDETLDIPRNKGGNLIGAATIAFFYDSGNFPNNGGQYRGDCWSAASVPVAAAMLELSQSTGRPNGRRLMDHFNAPEKHEHKEEAKLRRALASRDLYWSALDEGVQERLLALSYGVEGAFALFNNQNKPTSETLYKRYMALRGEN